MLPPEKIKEGSSRYRTIYIRDNGTMRETLHYDRDFLYEYSSIYPKEHITVERETGKIIREHRSFRIIMRLAAGELPI